MVSLREFTKEDAFTLQKELWKESSIEEVEGLICEWSFHSFNGKYFEMFAIVVDEKIVGYISLYEHSKSVVSFGVEVFENMRQKGFAAAGFKLAIEVARKRGYKAVQNQVRTNNFASLALHRSVGFETDEYVYKNAKGKDVYLFIYFL